MTKEAIISIKTPTPTFWVIQLDTGEKRWFTEATAFNAARAELSKVGEVHFQAFIPLSTGIKMASEAMHLTLQLPKEKRKAAKERIQNGRTPSG